MFNTISLEFGARSESMVRTEEASSPYFRTGPQIPEKEGTVHIVGVADVQSSDATVCIEKAFEVWEVLHRVELKTTTICR